MQVIFVLAMLVPNTQFPRVRRLSTISSVIAAAGHVFSTGWRWYWKDENGKWQLYDTSNDGHPVNTTNSQCFERDYVAGKITEKKVMDKISEISYVVDKKQKGLCSRYVRSDIRDYQLWERSNRHHLI